MTSRLTWVIVVALWLLISCQARSDVESPSDLDLKPEHVLLEPGDFGSVTWLQDHDVIVRFEPDPDNPRDRLWRLDPDDPKLDPLTFPALPGCRLLRYQSPHRLPDGRLGLARVCDPIQSGTPDLSLFSVTLVAYDLGTNEMSEMLDMTSNPGVVTWESNQTRAVAGVGSYICQGITSVERDGEKPIAVEISDGTNHFRLDEELTRGRRDCEFTGRADFPAYSHSAGQLAFVASPSSVNVSGDARLDKPWNLYVLGLGGHPRSVVSSIVDPAGIAWTSDDRWIIFSGRLESFGSGMWAVDSSTGRLVKLSGQALDWFDLSPDSKRMIGTASLGSADPTGQRLLLFDLSPLVGGQ